MRRWHDVLFIACVGCRESAAQEAPVALAPGMTAEPPAPTVTPTVTPTAVANLTAMGVPTATLVSTTPSFDSTKTDWCIDGIAALDDETCVVVPAKHDGTLLIYLHGIVPKYPESEHKTKVETIVKNAAERGGVVAMIPRGMAGMGPQGFESWYAWPTTGTDYARYARGMVKSWIERRGKLERMLGVPFARTYLAGSSSGAYFTSALAIHGDAPFDGFGAMSGGAGWPSPELPKLAPRPLYIGFGSADTVGGVARALGDLVKSYGWPVRVAEHPYGHGAREIYIDEALAFWRERAR